MYSLKKVLTGFQQMTGHFLLLMTFALVLLVSLGLTLHTNAWLANGVTQPTVDTEAYISIDDSNPYYWQYKDETAPLIGGSWQDNLFNHPTNLEEHLDLLESVGGNYVRNVMSHRNEGNVFAYEQNAEGLFNLDTFNEDYWERFEEFLRLTYERDMIVQLELWATWDLYEDHQSKGGWSFHPYNPENNLTWTPEASGLPTVVDYPPDTDPTDHPFFRSVPGLEDNALVLRYQQAFIDKILSYALEYPHVLYCMNNETGEPLPWGDYWAIYVRQQADEVGIPIHLTDMRRSEDIQSEDHAHIYDNPSLYSFVDISQNNAWAGLGQSHYDRIMYVRERTEAQPRPINNNKNYGAARHGEEESIARMGRILFAGSASARFHRPHPIEDPAEHLAKSDFGLGLSARAQHIIQSLRMVMDELDFAYAEPRNDLLDDREENEAYLLANPGKQYAVYFPDGGTVTVRLSEISASNHESDPSFDGGDDVFTYRWINLDDAEWGESGDVAAGNTTRFTTPSDEGHWAVVILSGHDD